MLPTGGFPPVDLPAAGLPLTAFEEFMFLDDRPSHPMVIVARFDFAGGPPPPTLAAAFAAALRHEPLLTARISAPRGRRPRWLPAGGPDLAWVEGTAGPAAVIPRLDPRTGPMIHAQVVGTASGWSVVVAAHHAACDGLGLAGFVERWFLLASGREDRRREQVVDRRAALRSRGRVATSWREFVRMLPKLAKGLEGVQQFVGREVVALGEPVAAARGRTDAAGPVGGWQPAVVTATLDREFVGRLAASAARRGVKVNDLLMGAFVTAIGAAQDERGDAAGRERWLRLATPVSLRTKSDYALPAVNRVSMVFLDRRPGDRLDADRLCCGLRDEMELIRSHHLGHILPLSLEMGRWCPGGLARSTRLPKPQSTAVLSNLGRCFHRSALADDDGAPRLGPCQLTGWWMVPPVRPGTAVAAATHETGGRRTIAFHVDVSRVRLDEARRWLDDMLAALYELAGPAPAAAPSLLAAAT